METMGGGGNNQSAGGRIISNNLYGIESTLMNQVPVGISAEEDIIEEPPVIKMKQIKRGKKKKRK